MKAWKFQGFARAALQNRAAVITLSFFCLAAYSFAAEARLVNVPSMPESKIVHKVQPEYPGDAADRRIQGVVKLQVTISETGKVIREKLISGHPLLAPAAMQAMRRWVYEPTLVDGNAVRVITVVSIPFDLDRDGKPVAQSAAAAEIAK